MPSIRRPSLIALALAAACVTVATSSVSAQQARYTLFGDSADGGVVIDQGPASHRFVHPITNVQYHEDAFVTTDIRLDYSYYHIDEDSAFVGGEITTYGFQGRAALTERFQVMVYHAGYMDIDSEAPTTSPPAPPETYQESGGLDLGVGLKWKFVSDWQNQLHMAAGVGYDIPIGSPKVFANDDELRLWYSVNKGFGAFHMGATVNYILALGDDDEFAGGNSDQVTWHLHFDYHLCEEFSPVVEVNGYHRLNSDDLFGSSGTDLFNLAGGNQSYTVAAGGEYRPVDFVGVRAAVEVPFSSGDDELYDWRVIVGVVVSFN